MEFLIQVKQHGEVCLYAAKVAKPFRKQINRALGVLEALTQQQFQEFYLPLIQSTSPRCYILSESDVLLCIESELGLLLLVAAANGSLAYSFVEEKPRPSVASPFSASLERGGDHFGSCYNLIAKPSAAMSNTKQLMAQGFEPAYRGQFSRWRHAVALFQDPHPCIERNFGEPTFTPRGSLLHSFSHWWQTPADQSVFTGAATHLRLVGGEW